LSERSDILVRPVDKRENFIKRCVGISGDTIKIIDGMLFVNGKTSDVPLKSETFYLVTTNGKDFLSADFMKDELNVDMNDAEQRDISNVQGVPNTWRMNLTEEEFSKVKKFPFITNIVKDLNTAGFGNTFPYDTTHYKWSEDNFGPLWIPAKGATLDLTLENIAAYRRVISVYENNNLEEKDGKFFINGVETKSYTFKMNYFWLMGDNRHNSQDSRFWGFVPEDHVVGKASLIWFSWQNGPRWKRLFNVIK
jgi:signal peptidase I